MIEVRNLVKSYQENQNAFQALNQVSFTIHDRDFFGIIGLSGAGKTTILQILSGLTHPSSGDIFWDGKKVDYHSKEQIHELQKHISVVFQGFQLLMQQTVFDNVYFPLKLKGISKAKAVYMVEEMLIKVGLYDKKDQYPFRLSGGEKQRVAIARALISRPKYVFLDEPTSALDTVTTKEIINLLLKIHQEEDITFILITHEIYIARQCTNYLLVMEKGRCIEQNKTIEIFNHPIEDTTKLLLGREVSL